MAKILHSAKNLTRKLIPAKVIQSRLHRRMIMQFADKIGLVYFGYVDQRHDEHSLIRGLTVSSKHRDNHYCVGTFDGYDIALVDRSDTISHPGKPTQTQNWIIMTFDLHAMVDLPHVFVGLHSHSDTFYSYIFTKFASFTKLEPGYMARDPQFDKRYGIYAVAEHVLSAERLFNQEVTQMIAQEFSGMTLEISEGSLYIYAEHQRPTAALLERMLRNGLWLSQTLDANSSGN